MVTKQYLTLYVDIIFQHGSDLMAMCMSDSEATMMKKDSELAQVKRTRHAAELLSTREDDGQSVKLNV